MIATNKLPENWWEQCGAITRVYAKKNRKNLRYIIEHLDEIKDWGFGAIEVFAPYYGGNEYAGLDARDYFMVDPEIGTMKDFLELIAKSHQKGIAVIVFLNLGYSAEDYSGFLKACDDVRNGVDSRETKWFLWSETGNEPLDKSLAPFFLNDADGHWNYSERAQKYYWVKWRGIDENAELPQFNFGNPEWQEECKRIVRFWMDTGIDGMIIDAVNWYSNCNWEINNVTMSDIIRSYGNKYIQPEGAGGFGDDPVPWITSGKYNSVQDYGLNIWWNGHDVIGNAIDTGDPSGIEKALRGYRDRVVNAGGVTYIGPNWMRACTWEERLLEIAVVAAVGELFHDDDRLISLNCPDYISTAIKDLINLVSRYTALHAAGDRVRLETCNDSKFYSFIRISKDGRQKVLAVFNFQRDTESVKILLEEEVRLTDILTGESFDAIESVTIELPSLGYRIFEIR